MDTGETNVPGGTVPSEETRKRLLELLELELQAAAMRARASGVSSEEIVAELQRRAATLQRGIDR